MTVETLLSHLDKVKRTGNGRWVACCPAHEDRSPSLSIKECDDGTVLIHCFGGCDANSVLNAVGMSFEDLYPTKEGFERKSERRPFPAADVLKAISFEVLVVANSAIKIRNGEGLTQADDDRLILAVDRIQSGINAAGLANERR
ncbi:MAG: DNA primase [Polynucleobacter sp. 24-46-87]|jgi:hypothetical protein|uniref:CHC2 zinc finger domain-containing protein n=1 Tax=Polynucleobacter sp. 39-46-10 TaxID=1970428 RepID=UPI000BCCE683|nr:CHC2 zinc finger domain-containing protein [Polynucleobacter sp. 39-46-10]OZA15774.1 MAG: DNA primase [Polynucleobacter sp. 24-46-87]OZA78008.1 MAG: DNA primase [Polynucleobacter sp. 39-46-10]